MFEFLWDERYYMSIKSFQCPRRLVIDLGTAISILSPDSLISFFCYSTERVTIWRLMTLSLTTVPEWGEGELIVWRFLVLYQTIRTPRVYWCCDSPPCYDFHSKPDMLFLGQTLSSDTGASQEYLLKLLKLCRSHFRKEWGVLFGKWKLSKPSLFFC